MKRFVNKGDISIQGVCSFMYRGYEISCSNTSKYGPEWDVVVFDRDKNRTTARYGIAHDEDGTVEDAIDWVNEQTSAPDVMSDAHDLLVELVEVVKAIPAEFTGDHDDLGDRIKIYLGEAE